jgi:hypothetical protein
MRVLAVAIITVFAPLAIAQRTIPARAAHFPGRHSSHSPMTSFLTPFLGDGFNPEDLSGGDTSSPGPAFGSASGPAFLLQATRALASPGGFPGQRGGGREPAPSDPLLIELHGDRYIRVNSPAIDGEALALAPTPSAVRAGNRQTPKPGSRFSKAPAQNPGARSVTTVAVAPVPPALPAAILIFRDGHSEEVRDYTIANGFLYARGDFYNDGYWNKQISLASLNLTQTSEANARRNVNFLLPASPNEVIARF